MKILGIDPGSRVTGYGLIQADRDQVKLLSQGVIDVHKTEGFSSRITQIGLGLRALFAEYKPQIVVIEKIFLGRNADSAFKLGHARGIVMYEAALASAHVVEYATRVVKKGVTGSGAASKEQVYEALKFLCRLGEIEQFDASDAVALAYYHATQMEMERKLGRLVET